ncbi:MAG: alpha/beta hydrolase [Candidatus Pacebacteria bacterium]|nr:alpha/beta hydrolase [Candidatus Paceibacterota bacterium]
MSENNEAGPQIGASWEGYSEGEALERLRQLGIKPELAFSIEDEKNLKGEKVNAEIFWTKIGKPDGEEFADLVPVESKIYLPKENANGELILFTPGFPGGNAGRFEQRYAKDFTDAGYAFATIRHNGTSLTNGKTSAEIMNSPKRTEIAKQAGEHHLGGTRPEGYTPRQMIDEPVGVLLALQEKFKRVHLMGQSMGVASSYNTATRLKNHPEVTDKIGNIVGIAGYVGGTDGVPDGIWEGMKDFDGGGKYPNGMDGLIAYELDYVKKVDLNFALNADQFKQSLKEVAEKNAEMEVPEHVGNVLVFCPGDPLIAGPKAKTGEELLQYGPETKRKAVIEDLSMPESEKAKAHSMLWIEPENLIRAVEAKVSSHGPHYFTVGGKKEQNG